MKKLLPLFILVLVFGVVGQTRKPANKPISKKVSELAVSEQIKNLQQQKESLEAERKKLLVEYQPTADEVKEIDKRIAEIDFKLNSLRSAFNTPNIAKLSQLETLKKRRSDAEAERNKLLTVYTAEHSKVKQLDAELAELDEQIKSLLMSDSTFVLTPENLPNDSIFLLKLIVIQNQRIIDLLEQKK